jgi:hypothetical protein
MKLSCYAKTACSFNSPCRGRGILGEFRRFSRGQSPIMSGSAKMNRQRWMALISLLAVLSLAQPAAAEWNLPSWLGGKPAKITKANSTTSRPTRPTTVSSKSTSKSSLTNPKSWFGPKQKSKIVSKWPNGKSGSIPNAKKLGYGSNAKKSKESEEGNWVSRMFTPSEPEPPKSVNEWMALKQIKP